jgi:hemoglobin-like flavoprotein
MHPMTARQIALVQGSWEAVRPIQDVAADLFYGRLFERHPEVGPMFHVDIVDQGRLLMDMIGMAVSRLDRLPEIVPTLEELGRRHAAYGVTDAHYDAVGEVLLGTLRTGLGDALSPDAETAWAIAYRTMTAVMRSASARPRAAIG